ncbi:hypothetical protein GF386_04605 [Candidatus Pacearchaeota archaeon]|nr:hypothetical protein [Candidatus Pacearchaeota archaeon]
MNLAIFIIYILAILSIVYLYRIKSKHRYDESEYLVSNRKIGVWGVAFSSLAATITAAGVLFAFGVTILYGKASYGIHIAYFFQLAIMALFAPFLYKVLKNSEAPTLSNFFRKRFGKYTEKSYALISTIFMFGLVVGTFSINIQLLETFLGMGKYMATIISFAIVIFYLFIGGFKAVVQTDKLQFLVMILFSISLVFFIQDPVSFTSTVDIPNWFSGAFWILFPVFFFSNIANVATWQPIIAAKNEKVAQKGLIISSFLSMIFFIPIIWASFTFARELTNADPNTALFQGMNLVFPETVIPFLFIMVYATAMSTLDTSLFYTSTNTVRNLLPKKLKFSIKDVSLIKIFLFVFSLLAIALSFFVPGFVTLILSLFPMIGITAFPLFLGLFTRIPDKYTTFSMLTGLLVFIYLLISPPENYLWNVAPALVTGVIMILYLPYKIIRDLN